VLARRKASPCATFVRFLKRDVKAQVKEIDQTNERIIKQGKNFRYKKLTKKKNNVIDKCWKTISLFFSTISSINIFQTT
jgi:hypothetical protein